MLFFGRITIASFNEIIKTLARCIGISLALKAK
jgi:hypothetical protein